MNTIRVFDFLLDFLPEPTSDMMLSAQNHLRSLVTQFDALAPDWTQAPYWAQWYAIDEQGAFWWENQPHSDRVWCTELPYVQFKCIIPGNMIDIPIGIDWRLCKWQRPEVAE